MRLINGILGLFGYMRVPKEAVALMMEVENGYRVLAKKYPQFNRLFEESKIITNFLRSGRWLF